LVKTLATATDFVIAFGTRTAVSSEAQPELSAAGKRLESLAQRHRIAGRHEQSVLVIHDRARNRSDVTRHDRTA
jgi:hypothetical protein